MLRALLDRFSPRKPGPDAVTWQAPRVLDQGPVGRPQIAMDDSGNVLAAWHHRSAKAEAIYTCRHRGARGWDMVPRRLDSAVTTAQDPVVAMNGQGEIVVIWQEQREGLTRLCARTVITSEETWAPYPVVIAALPGEVTGLQADMDGAGNILVVWCFRDPEGNRVMATGCRSGGAWDAQPVILGSPSPARIHPQLAVSRRGQALVVWCEAHGADGQVCASHFDPVVRCWSDRPNKVAEGNSLYTRMDMDIAGNAIVLLVNKRPGGQVLNACHLDGATVEWRSTEPLATGEIIQWPQVGLDGHGGAMAVWRQGGSGVMKLFARRFRQGRWEERPEPLVGDLGQSRFHTLAVSPEGEAAVIWTQTLAGQTSVYLRRYARGVWSPAPTQLGNPGPREIQDPKVSIAANGDVAVIWRQGQEGRGAIVTAVGQA